MNLRQSLSVRRIGGGFGGRSVQRQKPLEGLEAALQRLEALGRHLALDHPTQALPPPLKLEGGVIVGEPAHVAVAPPRLASGHLDVRSPGPSPYLSIVLPQPMLQVHRGPHIGRPVFCDEQIDKPGLLSRHKN